MAFDAVADGALTLPQIGKLALYEPPLIEAGSWTSAWMSRYEVAALLHPAMNSYRTRSTSFQR